VVGKARRFGDLGLGLVGHGVSLYEISPVAVFTDWAPV